MTKIRNRSETSKFGRVKHELVSTQFSLNLTCIAYRALKCKFMLRGKTESTWPFSESRRSVTSIDTELCSPYHDVATPTS